ncbi:hypothetical protein COU60_02585 [Candidatus Pacearchaeota archaeon CG10_big_fil_rev_8_21_14_0_10_34_76]|nr:MAG: hypothetical protein COU60_02585 [Candidatus Pacearchaeota archaeon CG10_big_fil_rev_8_21_14_0_10_34_76]
MPPSGFSQDAINGLLTFVKSTYENTLDRYRHENISEREHLDASIEYLEGIVKTSTPLALNGTVSREGIDGLAKFVSVNFRDLIAEISQGKKREGEAIRTELENIGDYLAQFKLEEK